MARARDPNYEKAKQMYLDSKGEMRLIDIAAAVGKSDVQIRKWKSKNGWDDELKGGKGTSAAKGNGKGTKKGNVPNHKGNVTNEKERTQKELFPSSYGLASADNELVDVRMDEPGALDEEISVSGDFTDKQIQFISYYVKYWNATKAYLKAYNSAYSTARTEGARLLANPRIRAEITRIRDALSYSALLDRKTLLQKWVDIAFADITDFVEFGNEQEVMRDYETGEVKLDANGNPKMRVYSYLHLKEDAEVDGTLISSVTLGKDGVGVKLENKMKALEYLSKHMDLLSDYDRRRLDDEHDKTKAVIAKAKADTEKVQRQNEAGNQQNTEQKLAQLFTMLQSDFKESDEPEVIGDDDE